mgnify:CR=1 FL=1
MPKSNFWEIAFAVNDSRNGNFVGQIRAIQLCATKPFDIALSLENQFEPPATVAFRAQGDMVRIGRKWFHIQNYQTWVGNWCWDSIAVDSETAAAILNNLCSMTLHKQKKFSPEGGWTSMWDLYEKGTFTAEGLERARNGE